MGKRTGCKNKYSKINIQKNKRLDIKFPLIAKEWHPTKNGSLKPEMFSYGSSKKVWWQCRYGHEWDATIDKRTIYGRGCPYCTNKKVLIGFNDLETIYPKIANEWNTKKNKYKKPYDYVYGSGEKVWWVDNLNHEWEAKICVRTLYGNNCPYCANKKVLKGFNDLETKFPEIAKEWHPTKNGDLKPDMVLYGSNKKVWWLGKCGHEWDCDIYSRTANKYKCPICSKRKIVAGINDLTITHPNIAKEWHPIKNGDLKPEMFPYGSKKKIWWIDKYGHEWFSSIKNRTTLHSNCPVCSNRKLLKGFNDLETKSPRIAKEWHPTRNGSSTPSNTLYVSTKEIWWKCNKGHEWIETVSNRTKKNCNCPYCSNHRGNLLISKHPLIAKEWNHFKNGDTDLLYYTSSSRKKVWWKDSLGHEWMTTGEARTRNNNGCPYCANKKVLKGFNDLETKFPEIAKEWHPTKNGDLKPDMVTYGSNKKVWWVDKYNHEWSTTISSRTKLNTNCPYCANIKVLAGFNDLVTTHPNIAKEWHPSKNGDLKPEMFLHGSKKRIWWLGKCKHEWHSTIYSRTSANNGCPYCENKKIFKGLNDLATTHPNIVKEWHPSKNDDLKPDMVLYGSNKKVWWLGKCGHEWKATINNRARLNSGCPYCVNRLFLEGYNDLATKYPDIAKELHPTKNKKISPSKIPYYTKTKYWWLGKCGHEWYTSVSVRTIDKCNCIYCNSNVLLEGFNDFQTRYPDLSAKMCKEENALIGIYPNKVVYNSDLTAWFLCDNCLNRYQMKIRTMVYYSKRKIEPCPKCKNLNKNKTHYY